MSFTIMQKLSLQRLIPEQPLLTIIRNAKKKTGGSTRNRIGHTRPKHRGWRVQDSHYVSEGTILATQRTTRFHPGLNVGFGRDGTLFAMEHGKVYVTCEVADPNWDHTWIQKNYASRQGQTFYKKYFNVIPEEQHQRFRLIDEI
uniref:Large ribosomal subunit protein bL27m n=1 Tax=Glossina palpalis gambiensis TaxID=67801 RepID=A0A1B0C305_9MUSC